ncbi:MAG: hypothetical protein LPK47_07305 [Bacteroidota bacterium]|nr:hypothetical protein [Bacteroidota bacterium]
MKTELIRRHIKKLAELDVRYLNYQIEQIRSDERIPHSEQSVTCSQLKELLRISEFIYNHVDRMEIHSEKRIPS